MTAAIPLLLIDDDLELCELLTDYLGTAGFKVEAARDVEHGVRLALGGTFSLAVLDVMLPGTDGFDVLRRIRSASGLPVLMLTARGDDVDRIVGLENGADDYLPKPFNPRELVARLRAVLRRTSEQRPGSSEPRVLTIGDLVLDPSGETVECGGRRIALTETEVDLLELLVRFAGQPVSREQLSRIVLGRELFPDDRSVDVHISNVRRKLSTCPGGAERIRTLRGTGYMYVDPAAQSSGGEPSVSVSP